MMKQKTKHIYPYKRQNGQRHHPNYQIWNSMLNRCYNKTNTSYANYGARGIKVCREWFDFNQFNKDMGVRPLKHDIDRINNEGNYSPENCHWISYKLNRIKTRKFKNNTTGYIGVSYLKGRRDYYYAYINVNKKRLHVGQGSCTHCLAHKYNEMALFYHGIYGKQNKIKLCTHLKELGVIDGEDDE